MPFINAYGRMQGRREEMNERRGKEGEREGGKEE